MNILHKYLIREVLRHFITIMATVVGIYLVVDFFERIDNFMEAGANVSSVIQYFLFKIPFIAAQIMPVGVFLSVLVTLGLMNKHNEITALKSCGIGGMNLLKVTFVIGAISGLLLFFLSETVVPITMAKALKIYLTRGNKDPVISTQAGNIWIKGKRSIAHIGHYDLVDGTVFSITIHQFDENFKLIRRIDAPSGFFKNGEWILEKVLEQQIDTDSNEIETHLYPQKAESVTLLPEDLRKVAKNSKEMSFQELLDYIRTIETEGYDAKKYRVDLHAKMALPFVCLIMSLVGTGIAVRKVFKDSLSLIIACGIGIIFCYWVVFSFCISLGYGNILSPLTAAWMANLLFFSIGGIALVNAE